MIIIIIMIIITIIIIIIIKIIIIVISLLIMDLWVVWRAEPLAEPRRPAALHGLCGQVELLAAGRGLDRLHVII